MTTEEVRGSLAYLEDWEVDQRGEQVDSIHLQDRPCDIVVETDSGIYPPNLEQARLIAAAPMLVRTLLRLEWAADREHFVCPACGPTNELLPELAHEAGCCVDAALKVAGFVTNTERETARTAINHATIDRVMGENR